MAGVEVFSRCDHLAPGCGGERGVAGRLGVAALAQGQAAASSAHLPGIEVRWSDSVITVTIKLVPSEGYGIGVGIEFAVNG